MPGGRARRAVRGIVGSVRLIAILLSREGTRPTGHLVTHRFLACRRTKGAARQGSEQELRQKNSTKWAMTLARRVGKSLGRSPTWLLQARVQLVCDLPAYQWRECVA